MKFEKVESFQSDNGQLTTKYYLKALDKGQGVTIGNALRRVLLTELDGIAISAVRVCGVHHEYGPILGVREDILEILLNLKQIKLQGTLDETCFVTLKVQGPNIATGNDIQLPENIRLININTYIASISAETNLTLELKIESGKGYSSSNYQKHQENSDFFPIDAIFTPVINVNFTVKDLYRFDEQPVEDLELIISTNGSITPDQALDKAAQKLANLFGSLMVCEPKILLPSEIETSRQTLIEELQLSVRAYNCLKRRNIRTINDLKKYSIKELKQIKNFGEKCANEVISKLRDRFDIILE